MRTEKFKFCKSTVVKNAVKIFCIWCCRAWVEKLLEKILWVLTGIPCIVTLKWYKWNNLHSLTKKLNSPFNTFPSICILHNIFYPLAILSWHLNCKQIRITRTGNKFLVVGNVFPKPELYIFLNFFQCFL